MAKKPQKRPTSKPEEWTAVGFLGEFMRIHKTMGDRSFAFLIGAGASVTSGIPAGGELARKWVNELYRFKVSGENGITLNEWATPENMDIPSFSLKRVATFYPQIYDARFGDDPESGYAYLEDIMKDTDPNIGYSILAQVFEKTRHKVAITTNFDNLIADALSIFTSTFPLVCGHESLTGFVRPQPRRPLVAKIHRDLLLAPKSGEASTARLDERWVKVLRRILEVYTPIVIGYGGNDGSLMDFLKSLNPGEIRGGMFWCYRMSDGKPESRIRSLVAKHKGKLIPIVGFDEFMLQLGEGLGYDLLAEHIENQAKNRAARYREQVEKFQKNLIMPVRSGKDRDTIEPVREAFTSTVEREETWWAWALKAQAEKDPEKREQIYRQGEEHFPRSGGLKNSFALFMKNVRKDYDEAERLFRRALELDSDDANVTCNFASFMERIRKDYDEAERLFRRALELNPDHAVITGNFALFMESIRKDYDEAERLYRRALELDPDHANITGNYANFMKNVRKDYGEAERLFRRALELDSDDAVVTSNFALFMEYIRKDYDEAERLYQRALELDPRQAVVTCNFALFMERIRKDYDEAERLYQRALELDPRQAIITGNLALFILFIRKDYDEAERLFRHALSLDPDDANVTGNYANFMENIREEYGKAESLYNRSQDLDPTDANIKANFAGLLIAGSRFDEAVALLSEAWTLNNGEVNRTAAKIAFLSCVADQLEHKNISDALGRLKYLINQGFVSWPWHTNNILAVIEKVLSEEEAAFYTALANAIQHEDMVGDLDQFEHWKEIEPISIEKPWNISL